MSKPDDAGYDHNRYRDLLAAADDEAKRLALIDQLVAEKARDRLARHGAKYFSSRLTDLVLKAKGK